MAASTLPAAPPLPSTAAACNSVAAAAAAIATWQPDENNCPRCQNRRSPAGAPPCSGMAQAPQRRHAARRTSGSLPRSAAAAAALLCVMLALLLAAGPAVAQTDVRPGPGAEWAPQSSTAVPAGGDADTHDFDAAEWQAGAAQQGALQAAPRHAASQHVGPAIKSAARRRLHSRSHGAHHQAWLDTHHDRTLYFMSQNGLGNQLRAYFSAAHWARVSKANLRLVRNPFVADTLGWADPASTRVRTSYDKLFARPRFHWVDGYPGMDMAALNAATRREPLMVPPHNCTIHWVGQNATRARELIDFGWERVRGQSVLCLASDHNFAPEPAHDVAHLYRHLQPAPKIQRMVHNFMVAQHWSSHQWVCMHIRRTDLSLPFRGARHAMQDILPLSAYADRLQKIIDEGDDQIRKGTQVFLATDDPAALEFMREQFGGTRVVSSPHRDTGRTGLAGLESAVMDLVLLSKCPILVGTYYSSYSTTAWHMGGAYLYQIGPKDSDSG